MASNRSKARAQRSPEEFPRREGLPGELDALIALAEERNGYISKMREALESGDDEQLKFYARKLCGFPEAKPKGVTSAKKK